MFQARESSRDNGIVQKTIPKIRNEQVTQTTRPFLIFNIKLFVC